MPALRTPARKTRVRLPRTFLTALSALGLAAGLLGSFACAPADRTITVESLLAEMVDLGNLARGRAVLQAGPGLELQPREPQGRARPGSTTSTSGSTSAPKRTTAARSTSSPI